MCEELEGIKVCSERREGKRGKIRETKWGKFEINQTTKESYDCMKYEVTVSINFAI